MTKPVANIDIATESFRIWVDRTNQLADAMSNIVLTTNAPVTGNCTVNGTLNSLTVSIDNIKANSSNTVNIDNEFVFNVKPVLPAATIGSNELSSDSVTEIKIASNAVTSTKIADGSISETKIATNAVTSAKIAGSAVDGTKIAANSVNTTHLVDNAVTSTKIATGAVTTTEIATGAVTGNELASGSVDGTKIANNSVDTQHIVDGSVTPTKIDTTSSGWDFTELTTRLSSVANIRVRSDTGSLLIRNDGTNTFFLLTDPATPDGSWNSYRPIIIGNSAGDVRLCNTGENCYINGSLAWHDGNFSSRIAALTANTSPAGTEYVPLDTGEKVSLQDVANLFSPKFISGWNSFSNLSSGVYSIPHGLSNYDVFTIIMQMKCVISNNGYSVGDYTYVMSRGVNNSTGFGVAIDSLNIIISVYDTTKITWINDKSGGALGYWVSSSNVDWEFRIIAL